MAELFAHQREALAVAARVNVLLCSADRVGKTFLAAMRVREWLVACDATTTTTNPPTTAANPCVVAVAPTLAMRDALHSELVRLCSERVWTEAPAGERSDAEQLARELLPPADDAPPPRLRIAIMSPKTLQTVLRQRRLTVHDIGLLVLENADEIHDTAPSLYRQVFEPVALQLSGTDTRQARPLAMPVVFATTRTPASLLAWDPTQNPLFRHIHVLNLVPVVPADALRVLQGHAAPSLPLLLSESFAETAPPPSLRLPCAVRDFLLGENDKRIDFVRLFRVELELGNSAAVYDDKKKQERVNRFIADAESVYAHLGHWCLLKYVELELQFHLQACLVEDVDNINRRRRQRLLLQQQQNNPALASQAQADGQEQGGEDEEDDEDEPSGRGSETLAALVESAAPNLDEAKRAKINHIVKVLASLASAAARLGAQAATPRLQKVAAIARCRFGSAPAAVRRPRCWVFVERRVHCTLVAEYLTFALASEAGLPPCCSMLGHSNARVVGALHYSSYLKIVNMFTAGTTSVLVTTSIASQSQRLRVEPPQCELVIVMDETQEPDKLLDYCRRAYAAGGVVKYVLPRGHAEARKFELLVRKCQEAALLDTEPRAESSQSADATVATVGTADLPASSVTTAAATPGLSNIVGGNEAAAALLTAALKKPTRSRPAVPSVSYVVVNKDTGAVLDLTNSVRILSTFCETLPGLDTYDRRPQYYIKRHPIAGLGMSASMKQAKKKKLKYNSKLYDKIDELKAQAEKSRDADDDDEPQKTDESYSSSGRFLFSAKLRLPMAVGVKKEIGSPKVASDVEAKAIVAFKGCQELVKKGLLDRHFCSRLERDDNAPATPLDPSAAAGDVTVYVDDETSKNDPQTTSLTDLSAQNSYDLPPVSAVELGLPTVRSLMDAASSEIDGGTKEEEETVSMCFYGIEGMGLAILSSSALYTGNTNTGWRYDFATSDVMEPVIKRVTLQTTATRVQLSKTELQQALHFHLVTMRLACMHVDDATREVDLTGDSVWTEFSEQNDKGYLVVPSRLAEDGNPKKLELDWAYLREIVGQPLLVDCWPLPPADDWPADEWVCVPKFRRNVCYVVRAVTEQTAGDVIKPIAQDDETWKKHLKTKAVSGVPIFGRWHTRDQVAEAEADQPLLHGVQVPEIVPLIRRVLQRHHDEGSIAQSKSKFQERYFLPQYTALLRVRKTRYFEAMGIVPLLYEFERKCQMSNLMRLIGLEVDLKLLDDATTKPAYERLEILGDTFLKLETSWHLFEHRSDVTQEGELTQLRRDIIRNDRLNLFAIAQKLHHYILYPAEIEQHPFKFWKPSCMGKTPENIVAPSKWIADVLEAMCGAYLLDQGEVGARHFLKWVGVTVPDARHVFAQSYLPDCTPNALYADATVATLARQRDLGFHVDQLQANISTRLVVMQQRLKYTFQNKLLLLEAITHPSVGVLQLRRDGSSAPVRWKRDYERLEYLGDAVIEYLTLSYAYLTYGAWLQGSLTQWKSATVSNDALGKTAIVCFGVDECILSGALKMDRESLATVAGLERNYTRDEALATNARELHRRSTSSHAKRKTVPAAHALNALGLPKLFGDVFEALVAAVFLDSGHDLQTVRDVFLGPLLDVVGKDAYAYVCRESGLSMDDAELQRDDFDMEVLRLSSEDDDDD
jgi:dsRNA-specific ribonuclease